MRTHPRILYGHRGAPAELPENTLESFRRAVAHGAGAVETDVHMTADGHVVIAHDPTGERMAGVPAQIRRSTLAEVQRWDAGWGFRDAAGGRPFAQQGFRVPTLEEALVALPDTRFNVDVKQRQPDMVPALLALLRRLRAEDRVLLTSFESDTVRRIRRLGYRGGVGLGLTEVARLLVVPRFALPLCAPRGVAAQLPQCYRGYALDTPWVIDRCHAAGMRVDFWTINDPDEAQRLLALGADGVVTDDPARIAPVFAAA